MDSAVTSLAFLGNNLYAGGFFYTAGGAAAKSIARWDGSNWFGLSPGPVLSGLYVGALAVVGTNLYVGGSFNRDIVKWDGSSWSPLGPGVNGGLSSLAVIGSDLYAAGTFTASGGTTANHIAKWDGTVWTPLGSGTSGRIYALGVSSGDLLQVEISQRPEGRPAQTSPALTYRLSRRSR